MSLSIGFRPLPDANIQRIKLAKRSRIGIGWKQGHCERELATAPDQTARRRGEYGYSQDNRFCRDSSKT